MRYSCGHVSTKKNVRGIKDAATSTPPQLRSSRYIRYRDNIGYPRYGERYDIGDNQYSSNNLSYCPINRFLESVPTLNEESPVSEEQYQERFWRRRLDGIGLDTVNKEFLAIEFKRTQDTRSNYVEKAIAVAQEQYTSLLTGLQAVGQVKGWKVQQLVFVGGTCGSVHVESFNKNMKALGVLESKWDLIRQKLVRRLLEEQDKVLRAYFAQKGGVRSQRGEGGQGKGREHVKWDMYA